MAGSDHAILDLSNEDDLQFTSNDYKSGDQSQSQGGMTQFPTPTTDRDTSQLIDDQDQAGPSEWKTSNFWTFAFYQQFFDIDTVDVKSRVLYSMVPMPGKSFLQYHIRPRPDLYGPFWVCVTLVFSIAISGNMADYLQKSFQASEEHVPVKWHYDFHKVSLSAMVVFSYASLVPAGLFGFMWWVGAGQMSSSTITFVELLCLYGYSLTIYIPVSLLWLVQYTWWQWICVLVGAGLSGAVLFTPIWPAVRHQASNFIIIVSLHLLLACGFMLYFFHVPSGSGNIHPNSTQVVPTPDNGPKIDQNDTADKVDSDHVPVNPEDVNDSKEGGDDTKTEVKTSSEEEKVINNDNQENMTDKRDISEESKSDNEAAIVETNDKNSDSPTNESVNKTVENNNDSVKPEVNMNISTSTEQ